VLVFLIVHSGQMEALLCRQERGQLHHGAAALPQAAPSPARVYLIHDGDSTHTGDCTPGYLSEFGHFWQERLLPANASWLNQAEMLLDAFEWRYLKRGSWCDRAEFIQHVEAAWPEYNSLYAHAFDWEWTIPRMKQWFAKHGS
jgi:hypothetical protein